MITFKQRINGVSSNLLNILSDFLSNRKQRVLLKGQVPSGAFIAAGVPRGLP